MPLSSRQDSHILQQWSWLNVYALDRDAFLLVGKILFYTLNKYSGFTPTPASMEQPLIQALLTNVVFQNWCAYKWHLVPSMYPTLATSLARYMLDNDWPEIASP